MENVNSRSRVVTLRSACLVKVIDVLPHYLPQLMYIPVNLKDNFINVMSKRGLITDTILRIVLHSRLKVLDLSEAETVTDEGLRSVAATCAQLRKLDLNTTKGNRNTITDEGVLAVARGCGHLQVVYLRRCVHVTDTAITALAQHCAQLRELNLGGCPQVTDRSLQALGQHCRFLKSINLTKTDISDQGVFDLANGSCSQALKEVHLVGCRRLTDEAVEAVLQFCPHIQILLFHGCPLITDQSRVAMEELLGATSQMKQVTWTIY